jgi:hypothetical protein
VDSIGEEAVSIEAERNLRKYLYSPDVIVELTLRQRPFKVYRKELWRN